MIHCEVQIVIGRRKTRLCTTLFSTTNLLQTYGLDIVILSFIPALVELLGKEGVSQGKDEGHVEKQLLPLGLAGRDEVVEELADVEEERDQDQP